VEGGGIAVDEGANVDERADGDEGDLAGIAANLVENEIHGGRMRSAGEAAGIAVTALAHGIFGLRGDAGEDGNVAARDFAEHTIDDACTGFGVPEGGGDSQDLQFGTAESEGDGEGVVNVVADVSVNDDFFGGGGSRRSWRLRVRTRKQEGGEEEGQN